MIHSIKSSLAKSVVLLMTAISVTACDMLESHPYAVKISGEKHLTDKNRDLIETKLRERKSFVFAMISDTQRGYDELADAVNAINARDDIDFVVHGGDMTEYGAVREFEWTRDILKQLNVPYASVIGNHDCLATGREAYETIFGSLNYSFTAGNVKFLCLNTNALEFDSSVAVPDFGFLKTELNEISPDIAKTIVLMHSGPFCEQFNNNIAQEFHELLKRFPELQFCMYGHGHQTVASALFNDGIMYYECANIRKRSYLVFTIREEGGYDYEVVDF